MKREIIIILVTILLLILVSTSCMRVKNKPETDINNITVTTEVSWVESYNSIEEVISSSDLIVIGKLIQHNPEKRHDLIFTKEQVELKRVFKGDKTNKDTIEILLTGGTMGEEVTTTFNEIPLLEKDKEYIFFLRLSEEGIYLILGGYQGYSELKNNNFGLRGVDMNMKISDIEEYFNK